MQKEYTCTELKLAIVVGQNVKTNQIDDNVLWNSIKTIRIEHSKLCIHKI